MAGRVECSEELRLEVFMPFRLNRLAEAVSTNLSAIYRDRFGLQIPEWRVLVTVGKSEGLTAQQIAFSTRMHKTRVSRAVACLETRNLLVRQTNDADGREITLGLTKAGQRLYAALVPLALQRESQLLSCLSPTEQRAFLHSMTKLELSLELNAVE